MMNLIPSYIRVWNNEIYLIPEDKLSIWDGVEEEVGSNLTQIAIKKKLKPFKLERDIHDIKLYVHPSAYLKELGELAPA